MTEPNNAALKVATVRNSDWDKRINMTIDAVQGIK